VVPAWTAVGYHTQTHTHHTHTQTQTQKHTHTHKHTQTQTQTHTNTHKHTHKHTNKHTHTPIKFRCFNLSFAFVAYTTVCNLIVSSITTLSNINSTYFMRKITRVWLHGTSLFPLITAHTKPILRIRSRFKAIEYLIHITETVNEDEPTSVVRKRRSSDDNNKQGRAERLGGRADSGLMHYFGACQY
jgi:hypothetical protein